MKKIDGRRRQYQFEINELDWHFALQPVVLEGGPGGVVDAVCDAVSDFCDGVGDFFEGTLDILSDPFSAIENPFEFLSDTWDSFVEFCEDTWEDIEETFEDAWESVADFCSDVWDSICDVWDEWGKQIIGIVAVVVCSWIPGVNAVVAAAVIGALQAGLESGWDLQAMAVGAAAGAISAYAGGIKTPGFTGTMAKMGCNAASSALQAGHASGWDLSAMGEAAVTGAGVSLINGKINNKVNFGEKGIMGSQTAGRYADNVIKSTVNSCVANGLDSDAVVTGIAGGVGQSLGETAAIKIDTDNDQLRGLVNRSVSSATSSAIVAAANGEDVGAAVTNSVTNATVRYAVEEISEQVYSELPPDEGYEKLEEYCSLVTDAVAGAAASVTVGGDFNAAFKAEFNEKLMAHAKKIEKKIKAEYQKNSSETNGYTGDIGSPAGWHDPVGDMALGFDSTDANMPQDINPNNPLNIDEMSPTAKEVLEKIKNGDEIPKELQNKMQKELESGLKKYGEEIWEDHLKMPVEKNWKEFKKDPLSYIQENPGKSALAVGAAGVAAYGAYEYYNSGKTFDVNTEQLGLLDEPFQWKNKSDFSVSLNGKGGFKREIENGAASLYYDAEGQMLYKNGDFSSKFESKFSNDGFESGTGQITYKDGDFSSKLESKFSSNGFESGTGQITYKHEDFNIQLEPKFSSDGFENGTGRIIYKHGDFSNKFESNFSSDGVKANSIRVEGKDGPLNYYGNWSDNGEKSDTAKFGVNYNIGEENLTFGLEGQFTDGELSGGSVNFQKDGFKAFIEKDNNNGETKIGVGYNNPF